MRVQVFWNITKKMWSVRDKKTRVVANHLSCLRLENCKFTVQPSGRERVLREKRKNIHAFVEGDLNCCGMEESMSEVFTALLRTVNVTYNPYKHKTFVVRKSGAPIHKSDVVILSRVHVPDKGYFPNVEAVA